MPAAATLLLPTMRSGRSGNPDDLHISYSMLSLQTKNNDLHSAASQESIAASRYAQQGMASGRIYVLCPLSCETVC